MSARSAEIADGLRQVRARIEAACVSAGRSADEVILVVVTKTHPAQDVRELARLGVRDVAENRDQEASAKQAECADLGLRWHFVGQLQTNKVRSVARYADLVHSVDRDRLVDSLARAARESGRAVRALVQVALDASPGEIGPRGGADVALVAALADRIADAGEGLELGGVMAVAPLGMAPAEAFARLAEVAATVRAAHPGARDISAGMSGDLEEAVAAGATLVRVGTAVLGSRPRLQ